MSIGHIRPAFRNLPLWAALVCVVLALVLWVTVPEDGIVGPVFCLVMGFVLLSVGRAGSWPSLR